MSVGKGTVMRLCGKQGQVKWLTLNAAALTQGGQAEQAAWVGNQFVKDSVQRDAEVVNEEVTGVQ